MRLFKALTGANRVSLVEETRDGAFYAHCMKSNGKGTPYESLGFHAISKERFEQDRRDDPREGEL